MASGIARQRVPSRPYPRDRAREGQESSGFLGKAALFQICHSQKFRWQLYIHSFHSSKLPHKRQFVMSYRPANGDGERGKRANGDSKRGQDEFGWRSRRAKALSRHKTPVQWFFTALRVGVVENRSSGEAEAGTGERGQTGSFPNSEKRLMVTSKTNVGKQISENLPSVPNSLRAKQTLSNKYQKTFRLSPIPPGARSALRIAVDWIDQHYGVLQEVDSMTRVKIRSSR